MIVTKRQVACHVNYDDPPSKFVTYTNTLPSGVQESPVVLRLIDMLDVDTEIWDFPGFSHRWAQIQLARDYEFERTSI